MPVVACAQLLDSDQKTRIRALALSHLMALNGSCVIEQQGIVEKTPDLCIRNLGQLSKKGMQNTDLQIIEIIRNKEQKPRYALQA